MTCRGKWTFSLSIDTLGPGRYTQCVQAEDNYGIFGDLLALMLTVKRWK